MRLGFYDHNLANGKIKDADDYVMTLKVVRHCKSAFFKTRWQQRVLCPMTGADGLVLVLLTTFVNLFDSLFTHLLSS